MVTKFTQGEITMNRSIKLKMLSMQLTMIILFTLLNIFNIFYDSIVINLSLTIMIGIIGLILAYTLSNNFAKRIDKVTQRMIDLEHADLSKDPLAVKEKDEIGVMTNSLNGSIENLKQLVEKANQVIIDVTDYSKELSHAAHEVKVGSQQVATTMQELSMGAENQASKAGDLSTIADSFTRKLLDAGKQSEDIQRYSLDVLEMTHEGHELMEGSKSQMENIEKMVRDVVEKVQGLEHSAKKISNLVVVIKDIADQTNLLALNAAIEAARAGEHGKGFAVVAEEVRKLAEGVGASVVDIQEIVKDIQSETNVVTQSLNSGFSEVQEGTKQIQKTGETFETIRSAVTAMGERIDTVSKDLTKMVAEGRQMNHAIEEITAVTEESAAGIEQTTAAAEETSRSMDQISRDTEKVVSAVSELKQILGRFKL
jgi:methyl-accepting chemotaxis protein